MKGDVVVGWAEKPSVDLCVGVGILALDARVLSELPHLAKKGGELDLTKDFVPYLVDRGRLVHAYFTDSFWYDVGSVEKCSSYLPEMDLPRLSPPGKSRAAALKNLETKKLEGDIQDDEMAQEVLGETPLT